MKSIFQVLGTLSSRVLGNLITLFMLGYWSKEYGLEFVGFISLFTLQISISFIFSGVFAGLLPGIPIFLGFILFLPLRRI